jgi:hypothetical protein
MNPGERYNDWMLIFTGVLAFFTVILAVATGLLFWVTRKAAIAAKVGADAASKSANAAAAQFVIGNRPKLIVRRIYFRDASTIAYEIANIGGIEAIIQSSKAVCIVDSLPAGDPDVGHPYDLAPQMIHAGSKHEFLHHIVDGEVSVSLGFGTEAVPGNTEPLIYFLGAVTYGDRMGISRRTAFCRRYDFDRKRFLPLDDADSDYEHVD